MSLLSTPSVRSLMIYEIANLLYLLVGLLLGELGVVCEILRKLSTDLCDLLDGGLEDGLGSNFTVIFVYLAFIDGIADALKLLDDAGNGWDIKCGCEGHHDSDWVVMSKFTFHLFDDSHAISLKEDGTLSVLLSEHSITETFQYLVES